MHQQAEKDAIDVQKRGMLACFASKLYSFIPVHLSIHSIHPCTYARMQVFVPNLVRVRVMKIKNPAAC